MAATIVALLLVVLQRSFLEMFWPPPAIDSKIQGKKKGGKAFGEELFEILLTRLVTSNTNKTTIMDNSEPPTTTSLYEKGSEESSKVPDTVNVPTESNLFMPIEGSEANFAGRQGTSSSSDGGDSSDQSSEEKKKRAATDNTASNTTSLTDSESSSELPKREREKRRRIDYLSTAKGGLTTSNEKLAEENRSLRDAIKVIREQKGQKK